MKRKFKHGDRVEMIYPQRETGTVHEILGNLLFRSDVDGFHVLIGNDDYYRKIEESKDATNTPPDISNS